MSITERTLRRWRRDALTERIEIRTFHGVEVVYDAVLDQTLERVLRMTQELLDQHLLRKEKK